MVDHNRRPKLPVRVLRNLLPSIALTCLDMD